MANWSKLQYGKVEYPDHKTLELFVKGKMRAQTALQLSTVVLQRCPSLHILFPRCKKTCLFGTDHNNFHDRYFSVSENCDFYCNCDICQYNHCMIFWPYLQPYKRHNQQPISFYTIFTCSMIHFYIYFNQENALFSAYVNVAWWFTPSVLWVFTMHNTRDDFKYATVVLCKQCCMFLFSHKMFT